jgi:hypothetical protein
MSNLEDEHIASVRKVAQDLLAFDRALPLPAGVAA